MDEITKKMPHTRDVPPGVLVHIGKLKSNKTIVTICGYSEDIYWEKKTEDVEECSSILRNEPPMLWVNVDGLANLDMLRAIGDSFKLHQLTIEDVLNTEQRPRQGAYDSYTHIVMKALEHNPNDYSIEEEQVSLVIGNNFVVSFSERESDNYALIRKRIESGKGGVRSRGSDYLGYLLMDIVVDNYFSVLEKGGERIEILEEELLEKPDEKTLHSVHSLKREMLGMRQMVWPLREALVGLEQSDSIFVHTDTALHLRDLYFHVVQIIDTIEVHREMLSGMIEIYLSSVNNKLNEVMKLLTMFAAIFIPLTLISGIYGMNFLYMPELKWYYGYPFALGLMLLVVAVMLFYFRRKKWL
ncbi:MAG: magnesium/cobalt transporter CorA [Bacillota bacterium]|nr:magnesium/cobalt transporter CorA [Bacillota bacterium]